ncbi:MAG: hemolysin III family protein [Planctomycetales bacterium]|nr:hemolysin III family protein [Planctomycetales bacterium]
MSIGRVKPRKPDASPSPDLTGTLWAIEEELVNAITHGLGLALAVAGFVVIVTMAALRGNAWHVVACSIYGTALVAVYAASTLYHSVTSSRWKAVFRTLDHACIFLMIAGTYTPFTLTLLRGPWGWTIFGIVWTCAILGMIQKLAIHTSSSALSTTIYVAMGWTALIAARPILATFDGLTIGLLLAGGLSYTLGVYFYVRDTQRYYHAIWHIFVLAGSALHYWAVMHAVIPPAA